MPGLVPGIHVFLQIRIIKDVDGRDKPGHNNVGNSVPGL
jgi:D-alanyl-D-alanine dipeptidase